MRLYTRLLIVSYGSDIIPICDTEQARKLRGIKGLAEDQYIKQNILLIVKLLRLFCLNTYASIYRLCMQEVKQSTEN